MNAFITGSRVYGIPREDSDIDLVVLVDETTRDNLRLLRDNHDAFKVTFGRLNLVLVTTTKEFEAWKQGTEELKALSPVTREFACKHLIEKRQVSQEDYQ